MCRVRLKPWALVRLLGIVVCLGLQLLPTVHGSSWAAINPLFNDGLTPPQLSFSAFGRDFTLNLEENHELLPDSFYSAHHHPTTGELIRTTVGKKTTSGCHFKGILVGDNSSSAAISICPHVVGVVWTRRESFYLLSNETGTFVAEGSSIDIPPSKCGYNSSVDQRLYRSRRSATPLIHPPSSSNLASRYVEMVVVQDHRQYLKFDKNISRVIDRTTQVINVVNALYGPLNIFVVLVGVVVWTKKDEIEMDVDADKTLTNFLRYRMERLAIEHPNDNAQLITDLSFEKDVVGKALKGPICTYEFSGGVNKDHHDTVAVVAATIAHELGHNFGMEHDNMGECKCPQGKCIMFPASNTVVPTAWSSCSEESIKESFSQHMDHCLRNFPRKVLGHSCGNGILDEGEQCDCGPPGFCPTKCCNPLTCKLHPEAHCGHGECCDLTLCKPKTAGSVCREASEECDLSEHCDGESPFCPEDVWGRNGIQCADGKAYCYEKKCTSHDMQCKKLWGPTGKKSDRRCFDSNVNGTQLGNCGYDKITKTYTKCKTKDVQCGTLHCAHLNERLEYGMLSAAKLSRFYVIYFVGGQRDHKPCRSAIIDLGASDSDPGQAPDGASCGDGMACLKAKCVNVTNLHSPSCEYNCFGNGVCNNLGHCHCHVGYAPPYCNFPGYGGSVDSGPLADPNAESYTQTIILFVIFLGIVPLCLFGAAWFCYSRSNLMNRWRLRQRKQAVKQAARQHPNLLTLADKIQISKPVVPPNKPVLTANGYTQNGHSNGCTVKPVVESNVDNTKPSVIRPLRHAPPPPPPPSSLAPPTTQPGKSFTAPPPSATTTSSTTQQAANIKRLRSTNSSIRRPTIPPPPKPDPIYENVNTLRTTIHNVHNPAPKGKCTRGDESSPLVNT